MAETPVVSVETKVTREPRPRYEPPRIQVMTEKEILNSFQITQAMGSWWNSC